METILHGLVGKTIQCETCKSLHIIEKTEEVARRNNALFKTICTYFIFCKECGEEIDILQKDWVPVYPNGGRIIVKELNRV